MSSSGFTGACQCGNITYESSSAPAFGAHCHCQHCRKSIGAEHLSAVFVPKEDLAYKGKTAIYETTGDSGAPLKRHFCPTCGCSLFLEPASNAGYFITAGSLDDIELFNAEFQVYCKHKASWDGISAEITSHMEMPPKE